MQDIIVCLVGESGSGKTTIAKQLDRKYNVIKSYTNRFPREVNEFGHTFISFENEKEEESYLAKKKNNMIAYTFYNNHHYFALKEQYQNKGISIYVIDPPGVEYLKEKIKDAKIIVIYLKCDLENRIKRLIDRVKLIHNIKNPTIADIQDRLNTDKKAFNIVNCDYVVNANGNEINTYALIKRVLKKIEE